MQIYQYQRRLGEFLALRKRPGWEKHIEDSNNELKTLGDEEGLANTALSRGLAIFKRSGGPPGLEYFEENGKFLTTGTYWNRIAFGSLYVKALISAGKLPRARNELCRVSELYNKTGCVLASDYSRCGIDLQPARLAHAVGFPSIVRGEAQHRSSLGVYENQLWEAAKQVFSNLCDKRRRTPRFFLS